MAVKGTAIFQGTFAQTGANVNTWLQIPTGIDPGAGVLLEMMSFEVFFRNQLAAQLAVTDSSFSVSVSRSAVIPSLSNPDVFGMLSSNGITHNGTSAGASVYAVMSPNFEATLEKSITLQPFIYIALVTTGLDVAAIIDYKINYTTAKVSGSEYLRLLAGGV